MRNPKCGDCDRRLHGIVGNTCEPCRANRQRLGPGRWLESITEVDEYAALKAPLVEQYAAIIDAGGRIFETTPNTKWIL